MIIQGVAARLHRARLSKEERSLILIYLATWAPDVLSDALDHVLGVRRRRDGAMRARKATPGNRKRARPGS